MEIIQTLLGQSSWPGLIFMMLSLITGFFYIKRTSKNQADEIAKKANTEAIDALQRQISILNDRIKYLEDALKELGVHVTITGEIVLHRGKTNDR